jgi:hypothetical protein
VKADDHVFRECLRHDYSLLLDRLPVLFVIGVLLLEKGATFVSVRNVVPTLTSSKC